MTDVRLYLLSGYATTPTFMEQFRHSLHRRLEGGGHNVCSELLMPYGDRSRSRMAQLREIGRDLRLPFGRFDRAIGAARALAHIRRNGDESHIALVGPSQSARSVGRAWRNGDESRIALVGHSGGGIAALQAATLLVEREGGPPPPVVLIGSPRCRIPPRMRNAVLYVYAVKPTRRTPRFTAARHDVEERRDEKARTGADDASVWTPSASDVLVDPVCRIGSFGGWTLNRRLLPVWRMNKHAPAEARGVPIVGGHADYFRMGTPYVDSEGTTNGERSLAIVSEWLLQRL